MQSEDKGNEEGREQVHEPLAPLAINHMGPDAMLPTHTGRLLVGALHKRYMWFVGVRASGLPLVWDLLNTILLGSNKQ